MKRKDEKMGKRVKCMECLNAMYTNALEVRKIMEAAEKQKILEGLGDNVRRSRGVQFGRYVKSMYRARHTCE